MDYKVVLGIIAAVIAVVCFLPYIRDIFKRDTKPHMYSWLVWSILQISGSLAMILGGAGWGALGISIGSLFCVLIFFLSFKYGTKNITTFDKVCLFSAASILVIWYLQKNAMIAVALIIIIDCVAFLPTYRKSYMEPHTETASLYFLSAIACVLGIVALREYSFVTTAYMSSLFLTNSVCFGILLIRQRK